MSDKTKAILMLVLIVGLAIQSLALIKGLYKGREGEQDDEEQ